MEKAGSPTPLTRLTEDETLFRDSVREFAVREIRPHRPRNGRSGQDAAQPHRPDVRAGRDGHRDPRRARRRRRHLLPCRARGRGAVGCRSVGRRPGRRAEHPGHQRAAALGFRGTTIAIPAAACRASRGCVRPLGGRLRERRVRTDHARGRIGWRVSPDRPQALDHQRQRSGSVRRLCDPESRCRLSRHHRVSRRARLCRILRRKERGQARHSREQHVRVVAGRVPRAARERAGRGRSWL